MSQVYGTNVSAPAALNFFLSTEQITELLQYTDINIFTDLDTLFLTQLGKQELISTISMNFITYLLRYRKMNNTSGQRGPPGAKGERGESGFNVLCKWMPNLALDGFRKEEDGCFVLTDSATDVKHDGKKITEWYSRSLKKFNLSAEEGKECTRLVTINEGHKALIFDKCLYTSDDLALTPRIDCYTYICVTFSVEGDHDQEIITDCHPSMTGIPFRGISATNKEVRIWGAKTSSKYFSIKHESTKGSYTTVFVEWKNFDDFRSLVYINGVEVYRVFLSEAYTKYEEVFGISVGDRFDYSRTLKGGISALELYVESKLRLPDVIKNLIISSQLIKK